MRKEPKISAEVLLRRQPGITPEAVLDKVARRLSDLGLEVVSMGRRSISVQCARAQFEKVFQCPFVSSEANKSLGNDFGPVGGVSLRPAKTPIVPADLQDAVDSVEVQEPPLLM